MWKAFFTTLFLIASVGGASAEKAAVLTPQDFARGISIPGTNPNHPFYRLNLPLEVLLETAWPDLRDIRVFNSQNESVPFWLLKPSAQPPRMQTVPMQMFLLPEQEQTGSPNRPKVVVRTGQGQVELALPLDQEGDDRPKVTTYLLEWRDEKPSERPGRLARMRFDWERSAENWRGQVTILGSNDLDDWYAVSSGTLTDLKAGNDSLRVDEISLASGYGGWRYWLVRFDRATAPQLKGVSAIYFEREEEVEKLQLDMPLKRISENAYEYALPHALPVSALRIVLPETNAIASAELATRAADNEAWRPLGSSTLYRLNTNGTEQTQPDIDAANHVLQAVRIVATGPGWGGKAPTVKALTEPRVLVFNARGNGPFLLAWGARAANAEAMSSPDQIPGLSGANAIERLPQAILGVPVKLGGPERLTGQSPAERSAGWKKMLLWVVLVAGAAALAWFAFRLIREVRAGEGE
ncbi:MAG: DUF3999 domain-containing protein [Betaproteobacteria bacterium]|nr:DUF3999 domain-containing protein [Betaproteobacteria bacterium]